MFRYWVLVRLSSATVIGVAMIVAGAAAQIILTIRTIQDIIPFVTGKMIIPYPAIKAIISSKPDVNIVFHRRLKNIVHSVAAEPDDLLVERLFKLWRGLARDRRSGLVTFLLIKMFGHDLVSACFSRIQEMPVVGEHEVVLGEILLVNPFKQHRTDALIGFPAHQDTGPCVVKAKLFGLDVHDGQMVEHPRSTAKILDDVVAAIRRYAEGVSAKPTDQNVITWTTFEVAVPRPFVKVVVAVTAHQRIRDVSTYKLVVAATTDKMILAAGT